MWLVVTGTWLLFFHSVANVIIPIDELIFSRGIETTNQQYFMVAFFPQYGHVQVRKLWEITGKDGKSIIHTYGPKCPLDWNHPMCRMYNTEYPTWLWKITMLNGYYWQYKYGHVHPFSIAMCRNHPKCVEQFRIDHIKFILLIYLSNNGDFPIKKQWWFFPLRYVSSSEDTGAVIAALNQLAQDVVSRRL